MLLHIGLAASSLAVTIVPSLVVYRRSYLAEFLDCARGTLARGRRRRRALATWQRMRRADAPGPGCAEAALQGRSCPPEAWFCLVVH